MLSHRVVEQHREPFAGTLARPISALASWLLRRSICV
jgi:hypothetical protein